MQQPDVDRQGEGAERAERVPAVGGDGVAEQADRGDRGEQDDPPQHLLHDGERRADEGEERVGGLADLERGDADGDRDDEDLQHVERHRHAAVVAGRALEAEHVGRHQAGEEVEPGAGRRRCRRQRRRRRWCASPGWMTRPSVMPMPTAISAVMANQASVFHASRAAPVTSRRLAIEATIARKTSGGTTARSNVTNVPPIVLRVSVSQLGSTSPVVASTPSAPMLRATSPRTTPRTSPIRTWTPNEGRRKRVGFDVSVTEVLMCEDDLSNAHDGTTECVDAGESGVSGAGRRAPDTGRSACARGRRHDAASAGLRQSRDATGRPDRPNRMTHHGFRGFDSHVRRGLTRVRPHVTAPRHAAPRRPASLPSCCSPPPRTPRRWSPTTRR